MFRKRGRTLVAFSWPYVPCVEIFGLIVGNYQNMTHIWVCLLCFEHARWWFVPWLQLEYRPLTSWVLHRTLSRASLPGVFQVWPHFLNSDSTSLLQEFLGRPLLLMSWGFHNSVCLVKLLAVSLRCDLSTSTFTLRWLITVSSTFQEVDFDGSLIPLFITSCYNHGIKILPNHRWTRWYHFRDTIGFHSNTVTC